MQSSSIISITCLKEITTKPVSIHKYQANTTEYISENIHRFIWHMLLAVTNNTIAKYITLVAQSLGHSLLNQMNLPKHKERSAV